MAESESAQGLVDDRVELAARPTTPELAALPQFLRRRTFVLVVVGIWLPAAAVGLGLYHWWSRTPDTTGPVFVVLVYLLACMVGSLLTALVQDKPVAAAVAIALMSSPLAATTAAAVLYGGSVFGWVSR